tara:strand:- start:14726 stop:15523 length:798 start_codon:yes stop_codon:yes gene_type:complete
MFAIVLVACSGSAPTANEPTPNIDATVEARAKELVAAQEADTLTTPTPDAGIPSKENLTPWEKTYYEIRENKAAQQAGRATPTPPMLTNQPTVTSTPDWDMERIKRDSLAGRLLVEADAAVPYMADPHARFVKVRKYVPVYMAKACLEETQPSAEGFNTFVRSTNRRGPSGEAVLVIRDIIAVDGKWQDQSFDAAKQHCLQPYLRPESVSDAIPAIDLILASINLSPYAKGGFETSFRREVGGWFDRSNPQEPYISWLCRRPSRC